MMMTMESAWTFHLLCCAVLAVVALLRVRSIKELGGSGILIMVALFGGLIGTVRDVSGEEIPAEGMVLWTSIVLGMIIGTGFDPLGPFIPGQAGSLNQKNNDDQGTVRRRRKRIWPVLVVGLIIDVLLESQMSFL